MSSKRAGHSKCLTELAMIEACKGKAHEVSFLVLGVGGTTWGGYESPGSPLTLTYMYMVRVLPFLIEGTKLWSNPNNYY